MSTLQRARAQGTNRFASWKVDGTAVGTAQPNGFVATLATVLCAAIVALGCSSANAVPTGGPAKHDEPDPLIRVIGQHIVLGAAEGQLNTEQRFTIQCPVNYVPTRYSL